MAVAYCWQNGVIEIADTCPQGALPVGLGEKAELEYAVKMLAVHGHEPGVYLVPRSLAWCSGDNEAAVDDVRCFHYRMDEFLTKERTNMQPKQLDTILQLILKEYDYAANKHTGWPTDCIHASAIITEEVGKLVQACIDTEYQNIDFDYSKKDLIKYAARVAAMAVRFLEAMQLSK